MYNIYAPNKGYTGIVAGVSFINGVGETDNEYLVGWFKEKGYSPEKQEVEDTAATSDNKTIREELEGLTVVELRELASASSIEGYSNMKKDELIQAIESLE